MASEAEMVLMESIEGQRLPESLPTPPPSVKRPRGRPRKASTATPPQNLITKRRVGRPRKGSIVLSSRKPARRSPNVADLRYSLRPRPTPSPERFDISYIRFPTPKRSTSRFRTRSASVAPRSITSKRPVGRPPKRSVEPSPEATISKRPFGSQPQISKRPVGRPRKEMIPGAPLTPIPKRGRGRPRREPISEPHVVAEKDAKDFGIAAESAEEAVELLKAIKKAVKEKLPPGSLGSVKKSSSISEPASKARVKFEDSSSQESKPRLRSDTPFVPLLLPEEQEAKEMFELEKVEAKRSIDLAGAYNDWLQERTKIRKA